MIRTNFFNLIYSSVKDGIIEPEDALDILALNNRKTNQKKLMTLQEELDKEYNKLAAQIKKDSAKDHQKILEGK